MSNVFNKCVFVVFALLMIREADAQGLPTQEVKTLGNSVYYVRELNGLDALLSPQPDATSFQITYNVKAGPVYENDTISGVSYILQKILANKIANYLADSRNPLNTQNTSFNAYSTPELTVFQLTISSTDYLRGLALLRDSVTLAALREDELIIKMQEVRAEIEAGKKDYLVQLNARVKGALFKKSVNRQLNTGDTSSFRSIDYSRVQAYFEKYYVPNNTIVNVQGNFDVNTLQKQMADIFKSAIKGKFNREMFTKIVDFKPIIYSERILINAPVQQPEIQICWMFPGVRSNLISSYSAFLLTAMFNDPDNYIQVKARKMGCRRLTGEYEANNFSGVFKVTIDPDKKNFYQTYAFVMNELHRLDKTLVNESMINAGKFSFQKQYEKIQKSKEYVLSIARYWVYNDESYFQTLNDSIFKRTEKSMLKFTREYITRTQHIAVVLVNDSDRAELRLDSLMPPVNESAKNFEFTYRSNIPYLEGAENLNNLNTLLYWLKENPDVELQVNGFSDKHELNKFKDDSMRLFIDSTPGFENVKFEVFKSTSFRLEMLRAMKIIKFLYDNGIEADRLKGTSMGYSSKTKEEQKDNMKCTLTTNKIIRAPSLYEYHYGKKKEPGGSK